MEQRTEYGRGYSAVPRAPRNLARPRATRPHPGLATCGPSLSAGAGARKGGARPALAGVFGCAGFPHRAGPRWSRPLRFARETQARAARAFKLRVPGPRKTCSTNLRVLMA